MRFVKATEKMPEGIHRKQYHAKYKGGPEILVYLNNKWCWWDSGFVESEKYPVDNSSWSAIEFLDEQDEGWVPLFEGILKFTKGTFPDAGPVEHLKKLVQEAHEAINAPADLSEYADCLLCILAAAGKAGINHNQLLEAAAKKLEECKGRKWQKLEDGTYQHLPPATT